MIKWLTQESGDVAMKGNRIMQYIADNSSTCLSHALFLSPPSLCLSVKCQPPQKDQTTTKTWTEPLPPQMPLEKPPEIQAGKVKRKSASWAMHISTFSRLQEEQPCGSFQHFPMPNVPNQHHQALCKAWTAQPQVYDLPGYSEGPHQSSKNPFKPDKPE